MKLYQNKTYWKTILSIIGIILFITSWWYTNRLVKHISERERVRIEAWAQEIQTKAQLVKHTDELFELITVEERKKGELWAKGVRKLLSTSEPNADYDFLFDVIRNNETVPVILTDGNKKVLNYRNLEYIGDKPTDKFLNSTLDTMKSKFPPLVIRLPNGKKNYLFYKDSKIFSSLKQVLDQMNHSFISEVILNSAAVPVIITDSTSNKILHYGFIEEIIPKNTKKSNFLKSLLNEIKENNTPKPIKVELKSGDVNYIYYKESFVIEKLKFFPFVQTSIVITFILIGYFLFSSFRKSEQDQVWVGMSKETAHQLGTPISSMMAWTEILKDKYPNEKILEEFDKDVSRLETIADRFSKIGSSAKLESTELIGFIDKNLAYLKTRLSKQVTFSFTSNKKEVFANINPPLFSWVIENITKNSIDAMTGKGKFKIDISIKDDKVFIDLTDTGKGMSKKQIAAAFQPGYTTKSRGWGLGLTLVKRIVETYHHGKVFVKESTINQGTTFRIALSRNQDIVGKK